MPTLAYLRGSKHTQDVNRQRLAVLAFARCERLEVHDFIELSISSTRSVKPRQVDILLARLGPGDALIVSELSRLGRSVGEVMSWGSTVRTLSRGRVSMPGIV